MVLSRLRALCAAVVLALGLAAPLEAAVVVSSKLSSESAMLGEMIRLLLNANGIPTIDRTRIGATPVVRKALLAGEIDLYVEYTGNAGLFFNDAADPAWKDVTRGYELGARLDYAANRIVWLTPANASNAWALAVRRDVARAHNLKTMSDFGRWSPPAAGWCSPARRSSPTPGRCARSSEPTALRCAPRSSSC